MDTAVERVKWPTGLWPALLFGALPSLLVLWDWATGADSVTRLQTMPAPVFTLVALAVAAILASGSSPGRTVSGSSPAALWTARVALGLFLYAVLATALFATAPVFGLLKLAELALCALLALSLAARFRHVPAERGIALGALVAGTTLSLPLLAVLGMTGMLDHLAPLSLPGFVHIRIMGFALALALAGSLGLWSVSGGRFRPALMLCMVLLWTALLWSGGRGALLAVILGAALSAAVLPALRRPLVPLLLTALLGFCLTLTPGLDGVGISERIGAAATATSVDDLASGRLGMWRAVVAACLERPFLGHGYAQANAVFIEAGFATAHLHAHNIVLDAILTLGLPLGTLSALTALAAAVLGTLGARRAGDPVAAAGAAIVWVFLAHGLVDGIHFYGQGLLPVALAAALLFPSRS